MNYVSSFLNSSVSILNFLSSAYYTYDIFSYSLCPFSLASLYAILALTYSGVSRRSMNSFSYYLSSNANNYANLALLVCKSVAALFFISEIRYVTRFYFITLSVFISHLALNPIF